MATPVNISRVSTETTLNRLEEYVDHLKKSQYTADSNVVIINNLTAERNETVKQLTAEKNATVNKLTAKLMVTHVKNNLLKTENTLQKYNITQLQDNNKRLVILLCASLVILSGLGVHIIDNYVRKN